MQTDLPARFVGKSGNRHSVDGSSRPGMRSLVMAATRGATTTIALGFTGTRTASELDRKSGSFEIGSI